MRVLTLDCALDVRTDGYEFGSSVSMYDYDIVVWSPAQTLAIYSDHASTYQGLPSLTERMSAAILRDVARRRSEFLEFVKLGRTVVVFLPGDLNVYVDTGEREYSGTGRNRHTTTIVRTFDIMTAVPTRLQLTPAAGLDMVPANELVGPLYRPTRDNWAYRSIIENSETISPLLYIKETKKVVGGLVREKNSGGLLLLLPDLILDDDDGFDEEDDDEEGAEHQSATASTDEPRESAGVPVGQVLLDWIATLNGEPESVAPDWAVRLRFPSETERLGQLETLEHSLSEVLGRIDTLKAAQAEDEQWKRLIFASGEALEREVQRSFALFGFNVEDRQVGRSDLRVTYEGALAVVEVKGLAKSAGERNAAQLEKWVSDEVAEGRQAQGILVVNSWRDLPVGERTAPAFPDQMLPYAEQRGHCLVTGLQLLVMVRTCLADSDRAKEVAHILLETVGRLAGWDDLSDLLLRDAVVGSTAEAPGDQPAPIQDVEVLEAVEPEDPGLDLK